jgi:hypothetical protein
MPPTHRSESRAAASVSGDTSDPGCTVEMATTADHLSPRRIRSEGRACLRFSDNFMVIVTPVWLITRMLRVCRDNRYRRVDLDHFPGADDLRLPAFGARRMEPRPGGQQRPARLPRAQGAGLFPPHSSGCSSSPHLRAQVLGPSSVVDDHRLRFRFITLTGLLYEFYRGDHAH